MFGEGIFVMGGTLCVGVRSFIGCETLLRVSNRETCGSTNFGVFEGISGGENAVFTTMSSRTFWERHSF